MEEITTNEPMVSLTVRLDQTVHNDITRIANKYGISYASVVRIFISMGLNDRDGLTISECLVLNDIRIDSGEED